MKDVKLAALMTALPDRSALSGIRAYIVHKGLEGDLDAAASVFHQLWQCDGCEEAKAEQILFLAARYAYRGQLETARKFYALFACLGTAGAVLQARAAALHILACMLREVRLREAVELWRNYAQLPIAARFKKPVFRTGVILLRQALKHSDTRLAAAVFAALRAMAHETDEPEVEGRAIRLLEKWQKANSAMPP